MSGRVRYSFTVYDYPADEVVPMAKAAEQAGFDAVWIGEHYVCPQDFTSEHPTADGRKDEHPARWIVGADARLHDPWFFMGAMAGATTRLKVGTAICLAPLNHPLLLARATLTAQEISGGRLLFGTGVGWLREEFDALQIPFESRGSRYDEILDLLRRAWAGGYFAHEGEHFRFDAVQLTPHKVDVPLIIGGNTERAVRRVAAKADGWLNSAKISLADAVRLRERIEALRREYGTDRRPFEYYVRPVEATRAEIGRFVAEGFENIVLWGPDIWPNKGGDSLKQKTERFHRAAQELEIAPETAGA
ncbi:MAG: TIGR03619 family F420-dependent LLM class oxidoreductase [Alphaproteobacteria bacterium]|nr:TIGR03619 family F420-dependent LLM class oxidoreductase [Alphaproteobacteria bacterium]